MPVCLSVSVSVCLSNEFSLAFHLRLGLALPFTNLINECDCGKELDKNGYHLLTCKSGGGPVWSHNCIMDEWTECLSDLHIPYQVEPRHHYTNTDNCPDITIFDIETGQTLDLDISLARPWSIDNVKRASRIDGPAQGKIRKRQNTLNTNYPGVVNPNVFLLCLNILVVGVRKLLGSSTSSLGRTRMWCSSRVTGENNFQ